MCLVYQLIAISQVESGLQFRTLPLSSDIIEKNMWVIMETDSDHSESLFCFKNSKIDVKIRLSDKQVLVISVIESSNPAEIHVCMINDSTFSTPYLKYYEKIQELFSDLIQNVKELTIKEEYIEYELAIGKARKQLIRLPLSKEKIKSQQQKQDLGRLSMPQKTDNLSKDISSNIFAELKDMSSCYHELNEEMKKQSEVMLKLKIQVQKLRNEVQGKNNRVFGKDQILPQFFVLDDENFIIEQKQQQEKSLHCELDLFQQIIKKTDLIPHPSSINKEQFKITKHKKGKRLQKMSPGDHWTAFVLKDPVLVGEIGQILVELSEIKNNQIMLGACSEQYTGGFYFKKCHQCVTCDFRKGDVWKMGESQCYPDLKFSKGDKILMEVNLINKQIKFNDISIKIPPKLCNAPLFYYLAMKKQGDTVRFCPVE